MPHFLAVVECAIRSNDRFLLIKRPEGVHAGGLLAFPGGKVEYTDGGQEKDVLIETAKREVLEEVGLKLEGDIHFVTSSYFIDSRNQPVLDVVFCTQLEDNPISICPNVKEVPEYYWMTVKEISEHTLAPVWLKRYVSLVIEKMGLLAKPGLS